MSQKYHKTTEQYEALHYKIAALIRQTRVLHGISQQELAARTQVTYQQIQKYENGKSRIATIRLYQLLDALDTPHEKFFSRLTDSSKNLNDLPTKGIDDITLKICHRLISVTDQQYKEKIKEAVFCLTA